MDKYNDTEKVGEIDDYCGFLEFERETMKYGLALMKNNTVLDAHESRILETIIRTVLSK